MKKVRAVLGEEAMEARIRRMEKEHGYKNAMYKAERLRERMKHRSLICRAFEGANEAYEQGLMGAVASRNRGLSSWAQMKLMEFRRLKGKVNIRGAMRGEKKLQLAERNEHVA